MAHPKLSRRIQLITLCPLVIGILICTILVIAILFDNFKSWVSDTKDYIEESEYDSLGTLSQASSNLFSVKIKQLLFELNTLDQIGSQDIELATSYEDIIKTVNYYESTNIEKDKEKNKTVWLSNNKEFVDFGDYKESLKNYTAVIDIYLKAFARKDRNLVQLGMVVTDDSGLPKGEILDYRYPIDIMEYVKKPNSNNNCGKAEEYSAECTESFQALKSENLETLVYTEENSIKVLRNSDQGAFIYYLPLDYFDYLFKDIKGYKFFLSNSSGNRVIRVFDLKDGENQYSNDSTSTKVSENLFDDEELSKETDQGLKASQDSLTTNNTAYFEIEGYYSTYFASISTIKIELKGYQEQANIIDAGSMISGAYINKGYVYEDWNTVIDNIIDTIIIQMVIFLVLLGITCFLAWVLAVQITERIIRPIYLFERFLRSKPVTIDFEKNYNKEVNNILTYLKLLKTLESMIEPRFFLHPDLQEREQNLKDTLDLFEKIKNKRGKSIILNLLGNIAYTKKQFAESVKYYSEAVKQIEDLIQEVDEQNKGEKELTDEEKKKYFLNLEIKEKDWEIEKNCLKEMIYDKKQQLCMGLTAEVLNTGFDITESRSRLKEISKVQKQIAQFYVDEKVQYFRFIKLLIDMASTYQDLKYYHTGLEILDIVQDELKKIEKNEGAKVDIDMGRLCKLGIVVNNESSTSQNQNFDIKGHSYEKDILLQMSSYRRGKILIECEKPYEAALALSSSIENGEFYDPRIRKSAMRSLFSLLGKNGEVPESIQAYKSDLISPKSSILFVLGLEISSSRLPSKISDFIEEKLLGTFKIGAVTLSARPELRMKPWQRDQPKQDFEDLIRMSIDYSTQISVLDAILLAADDFEDSSKEKKIMIVVLDKFTENGFGTRQDLSILSEKEIYLYILAHEGTLSGHSILETFNSIGASYTEFLPETFNKVLTTLFKLIKDS